MNHKFIIIALQNNRTSNHKRDPSVSDHLEIQNVRVNVNDTWYPDEVKNFNIGNWNYALLYEMYQDYKKTYYRNNKMYMKPQEFINSRPIYVTDYTKQPSKVSAAKSNITVKVDFHKPLLAPSDGNIGNYCSI